MGIVNAFFFTQFDCVCLPTSTLAHSSTAFFCRDGKVIVPPPLPPSPKVVSLFLGRFLSSFMFIQVVLVSMLCSLCTGQFNAEQFCLENDRAFYYILGSFSNDNSDGGDDAL